MTLRSIRVTLAALAALAPALLLYGATAASERRPDFDAFLASPARGEKVEALVGTSAKLSAVKDRVQWEPRLGVPTFAWVAGRLAAPSGASTPESAARAVLQELAGAYRLTGGDVGAASLVNVHDTGRGPIVVTFKSEIDGIEIFRERMAVALRRDLTPIAISGYLSPRAFGEAATRHFALSPAAAAAAAFGDLRGESVSAAAFVEGGKPLTAAKPGVRPVAQGWQTLGVASAAAAKTLTPEPIRYRPVLYRMPEGLRAAYQMEIWEPVGAGTELWSYVISAEDGRLLNRTSLQQEDDFDYRVWADPSVPNPPDVGPHEDFAPRPTLVPDGSTPAATAPQLVTLAHGPIATGDPWLADGATVTTGNNADAYADLVTPDGFSAGDVRADTTSANAFDRTYDLDQDPASAEQTKASVTQLFYDVNWLHDVYYDHGFDEASGNAQADNYGRGGLGGDSIKAEAQDFGGLNNSNMNTPADGARPRMQMFLWSAKSFITLSVGGTAYTPGTAQFGPQAFDAAGTVELADDGVGVGTDGCEPFTVTTGAVVLVDRGTCTFPVKVKNAQDGGAAAVIVANNVAGAAPTMTGSDATITIGSLSVTQADGIAIKAGLGGLPSATLHRSTGPRRDGSLDFQLVAHEWGHYLHHRLNQNSNSQGRAMSEGWGDFNALLQTARAGDDPAGVYPVMSFASQNNSSDPFYFGIRRMPYSTNPSVNPLTFKHITNGQPLPTGVPLNLNGFSNAEVHNAGEIWASMLWEAYAALLADTTGPTPRLTFDEARSRMLDYVVAGLKLTPADPTFVEAREAMLAAVGAANDPADYVAFCNAFARRGIGTGAVAPDRSSSTFAGVVESFTCGGELAVQSVGLDDSSTTCDTDGVLDQNETGFLHVSLQNVGGVALANTTLHVSSGNPAVSFPDGDSVSVPPLSVLGTAGMAVKVHMGAASGTQALDFHISWDDPDLSPAVATSDDVSFNGNMDEEPSQADSFESTSLAWSISNPGTPWARAGSAFAHYVHVVDASISVDSSLVSPPLQVSASGSFGFSFKHRFSFEFSSNTRWDGGVLEISTDGGTTWSNIAAPGYVGTIIAGPNPLSGRAAYTDKSPGYPAFSTETIDLGTAYQGQTVRIRFREGTDISTGDYGWDVDDVAFTGIDNTPFVTLVPEKPKVGCADAFLTVTSPDTSGLSWQIGSTKPIKFIHNLGKAQPVVVELNRDSPGGSWETIGTPNTTGAANSTFNWLVTGPVTTKARVRVSWATDPAVKDTGNADFKITPRIKVTTPNTAVIWKIGVVKAIKWTHNFGLAGKFKIGLDRDGDSVCETTLASSVSASTAGAGTFNWTVTGPATVGAVAHVCVSSVSSPSDSDISDVAFTIKP